MASTIVGNREHAAARVAGVGLLLMAVAAFFAFFYVHGSLVIPGDVAETARNLTGSERLFRAGIGGFLIVLVLDVLVTWGLYVLLRPVSAGVALLAAWFRLIYTAVHGFALANLLLALVVLDPARFSGIGEEQRQGLASLLIAGHEYGWLMGLVFFAFHLLVLGYLVLRSGFLPRVLGVLVLAAGIGYLCDSFAQVLMPNYGDYETLFLMLTAIPATIGEMSLAFWLVIKGAGLGRKSGTVAAATA